MYLYTYICIHIYNIWSVLLFQDFMKTSKAALRTTKTHTIEGDLHEFDSTYGCIDYI